MWHSEPIKCRMCGHEWVAVYEDGTDDACLECPNCGHMTGETED